METIVKIISLTVAVILHEVAHGYAAYRLGDPTARDAKRLTLNPIAHIDLFGSIILPLFLLASGSRVLFAWAKPVPFNPAYFKDRQKGIMIVGMAGPVVNFLMALMAGALFRLMPSTGLMALFMFVMCLTNLILGLFNMIPIPPLDGSRVVAGLLPKEWVGGYLRFERFGFVVIFVLLWMGALDYVILPVLKLAVLMLGIEI